MKFKFLITLANFLGVSSYKDVPIENGKPKLTQEQTSELKEILGDEKSFKDYMTALGKEIDLIEKSNNSENLRNEIIEALSGELVDNENHEINNPQVGNYSSELKLDSAISSLISEYKKQQKDISNMKSQISLLMDEEEGQIAINKTSRIHMQANYNATHLFASSKKWDSFENRPWNNAAKQMIDGDYGLALSTLNAYKEAKNVQPIVDQLNSDMDDFFIENPKVLIDLQRDTMGLPPFWRKMYNVIDGTKSAGIRVVDEITQAAKSGYKPKGATSIEIEKAEIFDIQVDLEFLGIKIIEMTESWLQGILMKSESSPYMQMSFVEFLISKYNKQRENEDKKYSITGIFVDEPSTENPSRSGSVYVPAGESRYRQNGLLRNLWKHVYVEGKIKPINVGLIPNTSNISEYLGRYFDALPLDVQNLNNKVTYMSYELYRAYVEKAYKFNPQSDSLQHLVNLSSAELKSLNYSDLMISYVGRPNETLYPLADISTNVIFTTGMENIQILENKPEEKVKWNFEKAKRDIFAFLDYKMGIRFEKVGISKNKLPFEDPTKLLNQFVWCNNQPIFPSSISVLVFDFEDRHIKASLNKVYIDKNWKTDVENITLRVDKWTDDSYFPKGMLIYVTGNENLIGTPKIKKIPGLLDLDSDFNLKTPGTITLISLGDGKFKEISRTTTAPTLPSTSINFTLDLIDASEGADFAYVGDADIAIDNIVNGVDGQIINIYGNNSTITFTEQNNIGFSETLQGVDNKVTLVCSNGTWYKF